MDKAIQAKNNSKSKVIAKKKNEKSIKRVSLGKRLLKDMKTNYILYLMILPALIYFILFAYVPMTGVQLAFKNYQIKDGIWGSPWVGLDHFKRFFASYNFKSLLVNTLVLSVYSLIISTITPIFFALMINYVRGKRWKKTLQMFTYLPYFISSVVLVGMLTLFLGETGIINVLLGHLGVDPIPFMTSGRMFRSVYTWSGAWQGLGFSSVIYIAALAGVDMQLHEAAIVDGASIWQRIWHIDLTELRPTILVLFIMGLGNVINVAYEKVLLMQNPLNMATAEVLSSYTYKVGLINSDYGFSTAVGLFNSVISLILLVSANRISKKTAGYSLW